MKKWLQNLQTAELERVSSRDLKMIEERAAEAASLAGSLSERTMELSYWRLAMLCTYERLHREREARSKCGTKISPAGA